MGLGSGEHLLLDLEWLGCLSIAGDPDAGRDLLRNLASELAMNSWADDLEVICVAWPPEQAQLLAALNPNRVHAAETVAEQMAQLRQRVRLAAGTLAGAGAADALAGRVHDLAGDSWMPIVALVYDPQPGDLDAVADLADELRQVGRCAVAVATTGWLSGRRAGRRPPASPVGLAEALTAPQPLTPVNLGYASRPAANPLDAAIVCPAAPGGKPAHGASRG